MTLLKVGFLLLSLSPPSISSNKCCEKVKITLGYEAELLHNKTSGTYVENKQKLAQNDNKSNYQQEFGNFGIYYSSKRENPQFQERWVVTISGERPRLLPSNPDPSVNCPDKAGSWQFYKPDIGWKLNTEIKITCFVGTEKSTTLIISETTTKPTNNTLNTSPGNNMTTGVIIGAGGGLLLVLVIGIFAFCLYKRRRDNAERDDSVYENPVYMYDYADLDRNNEVYDTNAYYGAADVDTEGSTVATDLNPDYE